MEKFKCRFPMQVRFQDTDQQGHVFFGTYFTYFDEGLSAYLRAIGYGYKKLPELGIDLIYVDARCQYKSAAYFEEILHVHTRVANIGNSSLTFEFAIFEEQTDRLVATGQITAVTVEHGTYRTVRVPDPIRQAVQAFEGTQVHRETGTQGR